MKILVSGTFCSGKTTLVRDVASMVSGSFVVEDECRPVFTALPNVDWTIPELRTYLTVRQILVENLALANGSLLLIDGGVVNNVAHDRALMPRAPDRSDLVESLGLRRYDVVVVCDPRDVAVVDDGQRYTDVVLRQTIHDNVVNVASEMGYQWTLLSGSQQERARTLVRTIDAVRRSR